MKFMHWMLGLSPRRRSLVLHAAIILAGFVFAALVTVLGILLGSIRF